MNIDMHHHFLPETLISYIDTHQKETQARVLRGGEGLTLSFEQGWQVPVYPGQYDPAVWQRDMQEMRLDAAALSPAPICFFYWLDKETAAETSRLCNNWAAELAKSSSGVYPMATVPMQDIPLAMEELKRTHEDLGMRALEIAPIIEGVQLDDKRFEPIYSYCARHGILLYLHPQVMETRGEYERYYHANLIGNVLETCIGLSHLLFGGVFDRYPRLRVLASHGGGYFPYQFGRLAHGYAVRPEPKIRLRHSPEHYLKNIYFDTITHWVPSLQFLVDAFGPSQVVIGTDYPFDMGDMRPIDKIDRLRLPSGDRDAVCFLNAQALLGGKPSDNL